VLAISSLNLDSLHLGRSTPMANRGSSVNRSDGEATIVLDFKRVRWFGFQ